MSYENGAVKEKEISEIHMGNDFNKAFINFLEERYEFINNEPIINQKSETCIILYNNLKKQLPKELVDDFDTYLNELTELQNLLEGIKIKQGFKDGIAFAKEFADIKN